MDILYAFKPLVTALVQPPGGLVLLALWCLHRMKPTRRAWQLAGFASLSLIWLMSCEGTGRLLLEHVLRPPAALDARALGAIAQGTTSSAEEVVLVLGSGRYAEATEYGDQGTLTPYGMVRLHYGAWLARQTGRPLAYSGGVGWGQTHGPSEADIAEHIARDSWQQTFRVKEGRSRDTRENAQKTLPLLAQVGVRRVYLVTHSWHMPRALRHFTAAAAPHGIEVVPAPMGFPRSDAIRILAWIPTMGGFQLVHAVTHELLGLAAGA